mgnify:CR=1 FL=1
MSLSCDLRALAGDLDRLPPRLVRERIEAARDRAAAQERTLRLLKAEITAADTTARVLGQRPEQLSREQPR